jgi:hypothetical protein
MMKFKITTLVDVTETNVRRGDDKLAVNQMANFMTVYQVIGLRTNPTDILVTSHSDKISGLGFGSKFKGEQNYWTYEFVVEADESISINMMKEDFDLVPFIGGLTETAKLNNDVFRTTDDKDCNIIFQQL